MFLVLLAALSALLHCWKLMVALPYSCKPCLFLMHLQNKEKVNNMVLFDKPVYDKMLVEVPKYKMVTPVRACSHFMA